MENLCISQIIIRLDSHLRLQHQKSRKCNLLTQQEGQRQEPGIYNNFGLRIKMFLDIVNSSRIYESQYRVKVKEAC